MSEENTEENEEGGKVREIDSWSERATLYGPAYFGVFVLLAGLLEFYWGNMEAAFFLLLASAAVSTTTALHRIHEYEYGWTTDVTLKGFGANTMFATGITISAVGLGLGKLVVFSFGFFLAFIGIVYYKCYT